MRAVWKIEAYYEMHLRPIGDVRPMSSGCVKTPIILEEGPFGDVHLFVLFS